MGHAPTHYPFIPACAERVMGPAMAAPIFISYRRGDPGGYAFALCRELRRCFGPAAVLLACADDRLQSSAREWEERNDEAIDAAAACVVVIGPEWARAKDAAGNRSLFQAGDVVRRELARALARHEAAGLAVFPALFGGAAMPAKSELPADLHALLELPSRALGSDARLDRQLLLLVNELRACPGMAALRPYVGRQTIYEVGNALLSRHFVDPLGHLPKLKRIIDASQSVVTLAATTAQSMSGVGKTQLALAFCDRYRYHYAGVWWFRAETATALEQDCQRLCAAAEVPMPAGMAPFQALRSWLDNQPAWLLVYDNVEDPQALRDFLPNPGEHRVLLISRWPSRGGADTLRLDPWPPKLTQVFLHQRLPQASGDEGARLCAAVGGLPLALEQACAYTTYHRIAIADYLRSIASVLLRQRLLPSQNSEHAAAAVQATVSLAVERLGPAARELLQVCAWLAPEPIPESLFTRNAPLLPAPLAAAVVDPLIWRKTIAELEGHALCQIVPVDVGLPEMGKGLLFHSLTLAAIQAVRTPARAAGANGIAMLLGAAFPAEFGDPKACPLCDALAPHVGQLENYLDEAGYNRRCHAWLLDRLARYLRFGPQLYGPAERLFREVLKIDREDLGDEHPETLTAMGNLAIILWLQGDLAGARALQEPALSIRRRVLGDEHPETLTAMNNLASTHWAQGDLAGARALEEPALSVRRRVLGDEHPDTLGSMINLAGTLAAQGDRARAQVLQEKALAVLRRVYGDEHPDTLTSMNDLAGTLRAQGNLARARALYEEMQSIGRRVLGDEHPEMLRAMNNLARTLWAQNDLPAARSLQEQTLVLRRRVLGDVHPDTSMSAAGLFGLLRAMGDMENAREVFEQNLAWLLDADPDTLDAEQRKIRNVLPPDVAALALNKSGLKSLAPDATHTLEVDPRVFFVATSLRVKAGERYRFTAGGKWRDGNRVVGPKGWSLWPFSRWNRVPGVPLFCLCGAVGEDDRQAFAIGEQFEWQVPADVGDLTDRQLYLFANDWPSRYGNNRPLRPEKGGPLRVVIQRLG